MTTEWWIRLFTWLRYGGLALVILWVAGAFFLERSATGIFLRSRTGMTLGILAVAINVIGLVGLYILKLKHRPRSGP